LNKNYYGSNSKLAETKWIALIGLSYLIFGVLIITNFEGAKQYVGIFIFAIGILALFSCFSILIGKSRAFRHILDNKTSHDDSYGYNKSEN
jgi:hypothetical protein